MAISTTASGVGMSQPFIVYVITRDGFELKRGIMELWWRGLTRKLAPQYDV